MSDLPPSIERTSSGKLACLRPPLMSNVRPSVDAESQVCDHASMHFRILGEITHVETFAAGSGIREIARLRRLYGKARWRKRKGILKMSRLSRNFVICLRNDGCEVSLERRKVYVAIPDETAARHHLLRVIDESGEDYLFPSRCFAPY